MISVHANLTLFGCNDCGIYSIILVHASAMRVVYSIILVHAYTV